MRFGDHDPAAKNVFFKQLEEDHEVFIGNMIFIELFAILILINALIEKQPLVLLHELTVLLEVHAVFHIFGGNLNLLSGDLDILKVAFQGHGLGLLLEFLELELLTAPYIHSLAANLALPFHNNVESLRNLAFSENVLAEGVFSLLNAICQWQDHVHVLVF